MEALCPIGIFAGIGALFALHRFWSGKIRMFDKDAPGSGIALALQEIVEPNVQHVIQVKEQTRHGAENGPPPDEGAAS